MHPNVFLKTFWRMEHKLQVFVAMSFANIYRARFDQIISPATSSIAIDGQSLVPYQVDLSKSGDSILTEIMDGIAHSQMVLADVSSVGKDSKTGESYRNGNVNYEVGLALACRQPSEVLLIRDDKDRFLFDVSTVPHLEIDFTDTASATRTLQSELTARLKEQNFVSDARVQTAIASLSDQEIKILSQFADLPSGQSHGWEIGGRVLSVYEAAIMCLLDQRLIRLTGTFEKGFPAYQSTPLGRTVAALAKSGLPRFKQGPPPCTDKTAEPGAAPDRGR